MTNNMIAHFRAHVLAVSVVLVVSGLFSAEAVCAAESAHGSSEWQEPLPLDDPHELTPAGRARTGEVSSRSAETASPLLMPPLRRLGALHVVHNTEAFRAVYGERVTSLSGFLASPWQGSEAGARLSQLIKQASDVTKRFWFLSSLAQVPLSSAPQVKAAYERQYRLDGWIGFTVTFAPEYTRISASLYRGQNLALLVSDAIDIGPQPEEGALVQAFVRLWARLGNALGHLGVVDWQSGDLVSLDIGSALVQNGEEIAAGKIQIEVTHPRTREVLRLKRWPAVRLQIVETQAHSALARIVAGLNAEAVQDVRGYLIWKDDDVTGVNELAAGAAVTLPEVSNVTAAGVAPGVVMGDAPRGFARAPETQPQAPLNPPGPEHDREWLAQNAAAGWSDLPEGSGQSGAAEPGPERKPDAPPGEAPQGAGAEAPDGAFAGSAPSDSENWAEAVLDPSRWHLHGAHLAIGQSWGSLDTSPCANKPCDRYSGFPSSLLNLVGGGAEYSVTKTAQLDFSGEFNLFGGNDVDGYELSAKALSVHQVARMGRDVFSLVAGPELSVGSAKTVLSEASLFHAALLTGGHYGFIVPEWGTFRAGLELSLIDLLAGDLAYEIGIRGRSLLSLPPPLGAFLGFRRASAEWSEIVLGATWDF